MGTTSCTASVLLLCAAASGCGYSESEMQMMRDRVQQLSASLQALNADHQRLQAYCEARITTRCPGPQ